MTVQSGRHEGARIDFAYGYDALGNVSQIDEDGGATLRDYTYDALERLTAVTINGLPAESYSLDPLGNRITSHLSASHTLDDANRLTEDDGFCYAYDLNGNLASKTAKLAGVCSGAVTGFTWDAQDQLTCIDFPGGGFAEYKYDALGRRIQKDAGGVVTKYLYDGEDIALEFDGADALQARYSHGDRRDQPLVMERGGQSYFYHSDHLGSVRKVTDSAGAVVNSYDYDAYGTFENRAEAVANPYAFTGREYDPESGLYYYRARYYDATTGRFISEDPAHFTGADPNLYRYVVNNPVNFQDPAGLFRVRPNSIPYSPLPPIPPDDLADAYAESLNPTPLLDFLYENSNLPIIEQIIDICLAATESAEGTERPRGSRRPNAETQEKADQANTDEEGNVRCEYCDDILTDEPGHPNSKEHDHVDPWSRGGDSSVENIVPACRTCNRSKGSRTPEEWLEVD